MASLEAVGFENDDMSSLKGYHQPELEVPDFGGDYCTVIVY